MYKKSKTILFISIILALLALNSAYALQQPTVTVNPDSTNHYGKYTIDSRLGNPFPLRQVEANIDSLVVIFNSSTVLPATIDPSLITVNDVASTAVTVVGQRVSILSPVELRNFLGGTQDFTIVIAAAAKVRNPSSSGSYTLQVQAVQSTGASIDGPATSSSYSIYTSTTTISEPSVAPSPSIAGQSAAYNISFNIGAGGYLTAGLSTITVGFDRSTTIPDGSLSGVTVNGTSASATSYDDTVVVTVPIDIDNEGAVNIIFAVGSGIENPITGGNYTLGVKTSSENTFVESDLFNIVDEGDFAISAVNVDPDVVNTVAEYVVDFVTSSTGALTAYSDTITVIFQPNTFLPSEISTSDIVLSSGGFSDNAATVSVYNSDPSNNDTLQFKTAINVGNSSNATITISASAGPMNPSEPGSYILSLKTSQDKDLVDSNPYQITSTSTTVSQSVVTPTSTAPSAVTSYNVDFNLGSKGRLKPGTSTITYTFNSAHTISEVPSNYNQSTITVDDGSPVTIPTTNISPNNTSKKIEVTIPSSVTTNNSDNIIVFLAGTGVNQPITNPSTSGNYTLSVKTSVETTENSTSQYTFGFTIATTLNTLVDDYVKIIFPQGTVLPSSISTSNVTINGSNPKSVSVVPSTRTVTAAISQFFILGGSNVTTVFSTSAGIVNPAVPSTSFYKAVVSTSKDIIAVNTPVYTIEGDNTQATNGSASANPSVRNASNVAYTVNFTTSSSGKLVGGAAAGSSTITVDFDVVTVVPSSISPGNVKVNSLTSQNAEIVTAGNGGIVRITLPDDMTIDNSSAATVLFDSSAGLNTQDIAGTFNVQIKTSSDTTYSDTVGTAGNYTITDSQPLYITSATPSPSTQNANASYSVKFTTGSSGALAAEDSIRLIFPSNTALPATMSKTDILINGSNPNSNPRIGGDTLVIAVPNAIAALTSVTVLINQAAGIINPTLVKSYTLQVLTAAEAGPFTSPSYNITQTSSTVSVANVTVETPTTDTPSRYTTNFSTGTSGRLIAKTSTITITFNSSTTVNGTAANYNNSSILVDGDTTPIDTDSISIAARAVTIIVPGGVSIDNNDNVSILLDGSTAPITNPSTEGSYTLQVRTSVESANVTSNTYSISDIPAISSGFTVTLGDNRANANSSYTISFSVADPGGGLTADVGTITITFPFNTLVPTSITPSNITVNGTPANVASTNPSNRSITITTPTTIADGASVTVVINQTVNLLNPSINQSYTLNVHTSSQPIAGTSANYTVAASGSFIDNLSLSITPNTPSVAGLYQIQFTTGPRGRLISGTSTITVLIPKNAGFAQTPVSPSKVTVNSTQAQSVSLNEQGAPSPDQLIITVPPSVTIGNNANVTVIIDESAELINDSSTEPRTYEIYTSVEGSDFTDYSLPVELSLFKCASVNGNVQLEWQTESEFENAYWFIQKKELSKNEFEQIKEGLLRVTDTHMPFEIMAQIEGKGNSAVRSDYVYIDSMVTAGNFYAYRLADVSYGGAITYHNVVYVEVDVPMGFVLAQNYPNPFNPTTTIKYSLPVDADIELAVYNILGQEVAQLDKGMRKAGFYNVQWNGRNKFDQMSATGMYIYRMKAKSLDGKQIFTKIRKMILIK